MQSSRRGFLVACACADVPCQGMLLPETYMIIWSGRIETYRSGSHARLQPTDEPGRVGFRSAVKQHVHIGTDPVPDNSILDIGQRSKMRHPAKKR